MSKSSSMFIAGIMGMLFIVLSVGCSSGPSESPEKFIMRFIEKHLSMIDLSVAEYYVSNERSSIKEQVTQSIQSKRESGTLDSLKNAVYDLSNIEVKVVDETEEYVDDEPANFVKVEATGDYSLTMGDKSKTFKEDEIFILQSVGSEWKVTEKTNPWK